jgi:hypothetical protein
MTDRVPDCERWDRAGGYCIEGKDCTCHASSNRVRVAETEPGRWEVIDPNGVTLSVWGNEACAVAFAAGWNLPRAIPNSAAKCPTCGGTGPDTFTHDHDSGLYEASCGDEWHDAHPPTSALGDATRNRVHPRTADVKFLWPLILMHGDDLHRQAWKRIVEWLPDE